MPLHDWAGRPDWEGMRLFWLAEIARSLRAQLPASYRALLAHPKRYGPSRRPKTNHPILDLDAEAIRSMLPVAEHFNMQFVDLSTITIAKSVIELVPESVARENMVIPLELEDDKLKLITADPTNYEAIQKLQFILNKDIVPVLAVQDQIEAAIEWYYGAAESDVPTVVVERDGGLVAVLELISPHDKSQPDVRERNVAQSLNYLRDGVHLLLVDVHRQPQDFSFARSITEGLGETLPAPVAPCAVSYRVGAAQGERVFGVWQHALVIGEPLPPMPLPLSLDDLVMVDLEATYSRAATDGYIS